MHVSNYMYVELFVLSVHGSSLDDFQQALTAPNCACSAVRAGGSHLRYLVLLLWHTNAKSYRHCTLTKLLWARVAVLNMT